MESILTKAGLGGSNLKTSVDAGKLIGLACLGGLVGCGFGFLGNFLDIKSQTKELAGIKVTYLPMYDPDVVQIFCVLQDTVGKMCPENRKKEFDKYLLSAIKNAECLFLLEHVASKYHDEVPKAISHRALMHHKFCAKSLSNILPFFRGVVLKSVGDYIDFITMSTREHVQNIDNMDLDLFFN